MQSRLLAQPIYMYMTCTYTYIHMHIHITLRWGSISPPRTAPVDSRRAWRPPSSDNHVYVSPCICICLRVAWRPPSSDNRATSSTEPRRAPSHVEHRATSSTEPRRAPSHVEDVGFMVGFGPSGHVGPWIGPRALRRSSDRPTRSTADQLSTPGPVPCCTRCTIVVAGRRAALVTATARRAALVVCT